MKNILEYKDIIDLPHHVSNVHKQMDLYDRAAQFAPFAALTGYDEAIKEEARIIDKKIELTDEEKEIINLKLNFINEILPLDEEFIITYFIPDEIKSGGKYIEIKSSIKKINVIEKQIILKRKEKINIEDIINIKSNTIKFIDYEE